VTSRADIQVQLWCAPPRIATPPTSSRSAPEVEGATRMDITIACM